MPLAWPLRVRNEDVRSFVNFRVVSAPKRAVCKNAALNILDLQATRTAAKKFRTKLFTSYSRMNARWPEGETNGLAAAEREHRQEKSGRREAGASQTLNEGYERKRARHNICADEN